MSATSVAPAHRESPFKRLELEVPKGASEIASITLGGLLFAVLGVAMEWKPGYVVVAAVGFALATWLARSLGRALICLIGALGLVAGAMVIIAGIDPGITETLGMGWGSMFVLSWIVAVFVATAFRVANVEPDFSPALVIGAAFAVGIAAIVAVKINFTSNLLFYVVGQEDNAAWVGLSTQNDLARSIATQFNSSTLGPVMPLILGVLAGAQKGGIAPTNAVFAAYTLAVVLCPLLAGSLLRGSAAGRWPKATAFTIVVFAWLFLVPALLYRDFGHLSTIWTTYGFLTFASLVAFDKPRPALIPVAIGVVLFLGGAWFPIAPLAALLALGYALLSTRQSDRKVRIAVLAGFGLAALAIVLQLRSAGIAIGTDLVALRNSLNGLYLSAGGVAQLDTVFKALIVVGIVGLSFVKPKLGRPGRQLFLLLVISFAYVIVVYAGSALTEAGTDSYGATKVAFVILFSAAVVLSALAARLPLERGQTVAVLLALAFGAMTFGGGTLLLKRSWPGDGTFPSWLPAVEKVVASQKTPRPVVCYASKDGQASYFCTRWAGAVTKAGDGAYLDYRLAAFTGTITGENISSIERNGVLANSDVIFLQRPTKGAWWGDVLLREGGRVFGPTGNPLKKRTVSAIELLPGPAPAK